MCIFRFADDIEDMTGKRPWIGWMICWKYISPLALFIVFIATIYDLCKSKAAYTAFVGCSQVRNVIYNRVVCAPLEVVLKRKTQVHRDTLSYACTVWSISLS